MRSIDQFQFYRLGYIVHPISEFHGDKKLSETWLDLMVAASWLDFLLSGQLVELAVSREAALALVKVIRQVVPKRGMPSSEEQDKKLSEIDSELAYQLKNGVETFETVFGAELHILPTYIVKQKGIYETDGLIEHAERAFDAETLKALPDAAVKDFREAGRCLAFELPTASAFHVMRCAEAVLRKYHRLIRKLDGDKKSPEWAVCINEIKSSGGNPKVVAILDQIRDLHRNPTMHPEDFLSINEALALFDVGKSAIASMAAEISKIEAAIAAEATETGKTLLTSKTLGDFLKYEKTAENEGGGANSGAQA